MNENYFLYMVELFFMEGEKISLSKKKRDSFISSSVLKKHRYNFNIFSIVLSIDGILKC